MRQNKYLFFIFLKKGYIVSFRLLKTALLLCVSIQLYLSASIPGKFLASDYKRALWMTTRFYGAQRCGLGPNWLLMEQTPEEYRTSFTHDADTSSNNYDLEGGWFDCGDHVTFGQTFFYSAYLLAKAYSMFPCGYHDLYDGKTYSDYAESGNWDMDGGKPDGIPDLLEELKYATDWMLKAIPDANTFYYQKGEGTKDHKAWVTAGKMSTLPADSGGEPRKVFKNPDDGVMPSFAAATLAIMSQVYKKYDPDYAQKCLDHARFAYAYAKPRKNSAAKDAEGQFYAFPTKPAVVAFIVASSEMFKATGEATFKSDAQADQSQIVFHNYGLDYSNCHDLAPLAMGTCLKDTAKLSLTKTMFLDQYTKNLNAEGVATKGNSSWGALRYPANFAFLAACWSQAQTKKTAILDTFIYKQVDYILGANKSKQSFIVGFCDSCLKQPQHPHHRNVYLRNDNPPDSTHESMTIPDRNKYFGYMVGGSWNSGDFKDDILQYAFTEGGLDYNAGLVGALAYIVNKLDPADTGAMTGIKASFQDRRLPQATSLMIRRSGASLLFSASDNSRIMEIEAFDQLGKRIYSRRSGAQIVQSTFPPAHGVVYVRARLSDGVCIVRPFYIL